MPTNEPRITVSIKRSADGSRATGELNSLSLGFGIFQVWLFMAVYNSVRMFSPSTLLPSFPYLPEELANPVLTSFLLVGGCCLVGLGITNQRFLRFYVSKRALFAATLICCVGTALLYAGCIPGVGTMLALFAGALMGLGSSLLFVIWGTTFSRFQFATIVLNTAISYVVGISISVICANWVPAPINGLITVLLPLASMPILMHLIPKPYYQRHEEPIFRPLSDSKINESSFILRLGFPVLVVGITLGALRMVCIGQVLPSGTLAVQLVFGLSCITSLIIFILAIAMTKRDMFWDTLFRVVMPVTMAGIACIALLVGAYEVQAAFFISMGYVSLEIMLWVFFAGIAQQFRISPIFLFGIGRGLLDFGSVFGSLITSQLVSTSASELGLAHSALLLAVVLSIGYAFLPRYREIRGMVTHPHEPVEHTEAPVHMWTPPPAPTPPTAPARPPIPSSAPMGATVTLGPYGGTVNPAQVILPTQAPAASVAQEATADVLSAESEAAQQAEEEKGSFRRRCDELAERYLLSAREKEVLVILAKGHNANFIQEELCVSKSTAKTHINHIYKKMDIHTQQELLKMVEDRPRLSKRKAKATTTKTEATRTPKAPKPRGKSLRSDIFAN